MACLFWQRVQVEIALAAQVQAELKNKDLTALEEVKLMKALEETCSFARSDWLAFHCKAENSKLEGKMRSAQNEAAHINWHYVPAISAQTTAEGFFSIWFRLMTKSND